MNGAERRYRETVMRVSFALLLFCGISMVTDVLLSLVAILTSGLSAVAAELWWEGMEALMYIAVFTLPVLFFYRIPSPVPAERMYLSFSLPKGTPLYIFAGISVVGAASYVNAYMVSIFDYSDFSEEVLWQTDVTSNYQLVLLFFTLAVIPAFVEELLFRGLVLTNLLPYGRGWAIVGSAVLFGIMHGNIEQLFYATAAGVVLGYVYVKTKSIWPCVLIHFVNNCQSVFRTAISERLPSSLYVNMVYVERGVLMAVGVLSFVLLMLRERPHGMDVYRHGAFLKRLPEGEDYTAYPISLERRTKLFFTVPMILYFGYCIYKMLSLLLTAVFFF